MLNIYDKMKWTIVCWSQTTFGFYRFFLPEQTTMQEYESLVECLFAFVCACVLKSNKITRSQKILRNEKIIVFLSLSFVRSQIEIHFDSKYNIRCPATCVSTCSLHISFIVRQCFPACEISYHVIDENLSSRVC